MGYDSITYGMDATILVNACKAALKMGGAATAIANGANEEAVAMYLRDGMIYQEILKRTGASSATISRVNRCLQYGAEGYQTILPRMEAFWEEEKNKE